jgi:hypothetical protein
MENEICKEARDSSDMPVWIMMLDGSIYVSQQALEDATITSAQITI